MLSYLASQYQISSDSLALFAGGRPWSDGTLYAFTRDDKPYLLKVMTYKPEDIHAPLRIRERLDFIHYLSSQGARTIQPITDRDNQLVLTFPTEDKLQVAYAWSKLPGEHFQDNTSSALTAFYTQWGKTLGKLHRLATQYPHWQHSACTDEQGIPLISRAWEYELFHNWLQDDEVKQVWKDIHAELDGRAWTRSNHGFVHNDAHAGNLLLHEGKVYVLDFDVANYQPFMLDIGIILHSEFNRIRQNKLQDLFTDYRMTVMNHFRSGYEDEYVLPESEWQHVELFLQYRRIIMFAVFYEEIRTHAPDYLALMRERIVKRESIFHQSSF